MKTKLLTALFLAVTLAWLTGCETTVDTRVGASDVVYSNGWLKFKEYATYEKGWEAAMATMRDLNCAVVSQNRDAVMGKIIARAMGDKKIQVEVNKVSGTVVEFQIQVDILGNEADSKVIRDAIRKHL